MVVNKNFDQSQCQHFGEWLMIAAQSMVTRDLHNHNALWLSPSLRNAAMLKSSIIEATNRGHCLVRPIRYRPSCVFIKVCAPASHVPLISREYSLANIWSIQSDSVLQKKSVLTQYMFCTTRTIIWVLLSKSSTCRKKAVLLLCKERSVQELDIGTSATYKWSAAIICTMIQASRAI